MNKKLFILKFDYFECLFTRNKRNNLRSHVDLIPENDFIEGEPKKSRPKEATPI